MVSLASLKHQLARLLATGFFSGYSPLVSGTVGSASCIALWAALQAVELLSSPHSALLFLVGVTLAGFWSSYELVRNLTPDPETKKVDPSFIVVDEWVGMLISVWGLHYTQYGEVLIAFVLFRLFDIIKPGPVRWVEKYPYGVGILLDDILAGILALGIRIVIT